MKFVSKGFVLLLFALLLVCTAVVLEMTLDDKGKVAELTDVYGLQSPSIPLEEGVFTDTERASEFALLGFGEEAGRRYDNYYLNRAYQGAPPTIPHSIKDDGIIGENSCLKCHQNGGYVAQFDAFAPVTPHPHLVSCRQCHVPTNTTGLFKASEWKSIDGIQLHNRALVSSPPTIPHAIAMRENCLSCHSGPSAVKELRVTHPERTNCLQCHAKAEKADVLDEWVRPGTSNTKAEKP